VVASAWLTALNVEASASAEVVGSFVPAMLTVEMVKVEEDAG